MSETSQINSQSTQPNLAKYRSLIILSFAFFALVVLLSGLTFVASKQLAEATQELDLSSRQTVLIQQMSKNLMDLNLRLSTGHLATSKRPDGAISIDDLPQASIYQLQELQQQAEYFSTTLSALKNGGMAIDAHGNEVKIEAIDEPELQNILTRIETIWTPYFGLLGNFTKDSQQGFIKKETSDYLVDYARSYNTALQSETVDFSTHLNGLIQQNTDRLRVVQVSGVGVAFLLFLGIVFGALRQLSRADEKLAEAREQTAEILATVNEGLFLINKELVISNEYSSELEHIIQQTNLGGKTLTEVLEKLVPAKDLQDTKTFVDQLYSEWVVEDLIVDLNPLKRLKIQALSERGGVEERYLDFNFSRVYYNDEIVRILVSVVDITQAVLLEKRLENEKAQNDRQIEMLGTIINAEPVLLNSFINATLARIDKVNGTLKTPGSGLDELKAKAREIYREIHSLKGEASALKLSGFVTLCQEIENKVKNLNDKIDLTGNDFLGMAVNLEELLSLTLFIQSLAERIGYTSTERVGALSMPTQNHHQDAFADFDSIHHDEITIGEEVSVRSQGILDTYFSNFAHDIAERHNKTIQFSSSGFDDIELSLEKQNTIKDISIQLIRNAVVHGIETPSERLGRNKSATGRISLSLTRQDDGNLSLILIDDGQGINYDKIRRKAVEMGHQVEVVQGWTHRELLNLLFKSGFSTAERVDEDAGRGVGLDIIKTLVNDLNGVLKVASKPNQYTRFNISFPS